MTAKNCLSLWSDTYSSTDMPEFIGSQTRRSIEAGDEEEVSQTRLARATLPSKSGDFRLQLSPLTGPTAGSLDRERDPRIS
jgi:hypothetical protein